MTIEILDKAEEDLIEGFQFYEAQGEGLGHHFLTCLYSEIDSLRDFAGIHRIVYRHYHRMLSGRFPFAVFYTVLENRVLVHAVVDCRRHPAWIRGHLWKR